MSFNQQFGIGAEDLLVAGQREAESRGRRRITRQQATILENAFNENAKPNRNIRQELAQVLAISPRNVQVFSNFLPISNEKIWFQNRRQKAKLLKKTVEQRTREVLEEATKKTEAEQAQKLQHVDASTSSPRALVRDESPSTPPRGQKSPASTENTPTQARESNSPYASPQEASYASLARSIAVAAAAAAVANGPASVPATAGIPMLGHNPFFTSPMMTRSVSTFTDCSTLDSPTPSYPGTPFDYPRNAGPLGETALPSNDPLNIGIAHQFPDFAAAVDAHMLKRPTTLLHPRQAEIAGSETTRRGGRPTLTRINSCPADFVDAFGSVQLATPVGERPPQITLAAVAEQHTKKRRPRLSPLGVGMARSKSSMGVCQTATGAYFPADVQQLSIPQPSPTLAQVARSTPTSPVEAQASASPINIALKRESPEKLNKTSFLSVDVPPTPISPSGTQVANPNMLNESPTLSLARAAGLTQLKKPQLALNTEDIFSPPATPAHSLNQQRGYSLPIKDNASNVFTFGSYDDQFSSSPTQFYIPEASSGMEDYTVDTGSMDDIFSMSGNSSQEMDEIDFSSYLDL